MTADVQPYVTDEEHGDTWRLLLGDSCERLCELPADTADLAIYSPPFASLYTYSPSERDLGNCATLQEFLAHYQFVVQQLLRLVKPGRIVAVHCAQIPTQKWRDGNIGLRDFRGAIIQAHVDAGFIFHGEITVDKDPQAQAIRTKSTSLLFVSLERDGTAVRPALADYVVLFRVPGDNEVPVDVDVTREEWIQWARPIWSGIRETNTLNTVAAKESADERHICPLQLDLIERVIRLYSNTGETVVSPFAGIGSEGVVALRHNRRFVGVELKPSYFQVAAKNLQVAAADDLPSLFDEAS